MYRSNNMKKTGNHRLPVQWHSRTMLQRLPSIMSVTSATSGVLAAGAQGDADDAVGAYIAGELKHDQSAVDIDEICGHDGGEGHEH